MNPTPSPGFVLPGAVLLVLAGCRANGAPEADSPEEVGPTPASAATVGAREASHLERRQRAEALEAEGRFEEAIVAYELAERIDPEGRMVEPAENPEYLATLRKARLLKRVGRLKEALRAFNEVGRKQPDLVEVQKARDSIGRAFRTPRGS